MLRTKLLARNLRNWCGTLLCLAAAWHASGCQQTHRQAIHSGSSLGSVAPSVLPGVASNALPSYSEPIELAAAELPIEEPAPLLEASGGPAESEPPAPERRSAETRATKPRPTTVAKPLAVEHGPVVRAAPVRGRKTAEARPASLARQASAEEPLAEEALAEEALAEEFSAEEFSTEQYGESAEPAPAFPAPETITPPSYVEPGMVPTGPIPAGPIPAAPVAPFTPGIGPPANIYGAPRELSKMQLPAYRIEPPDILQIEAIYVGPKPDYRLRTLDSLLIFVAGAIEDFPINGDYVLEPGGMINLGPQYGRVKVGGMTLGEAEQAIEEHLSTQLREPEADVSLGAVAASQQISGPHLVGPDGTVNLGTYGSVSVVDLTIAEAKLAIEAHLGQFLESPEISVDVFAYNSKVFYVITQGAGLGDTAARFPITGNETVLDALTLINGLSPTSSTRIWVARPDASGSSCQILPVDWCAVTRCGSPGTNFQLMPGDRVYVDEDRLVAFDNHLAKLLAPLERIMGFTALGTNTVSRLHFFNRGNTNFGGGVIVP